MGRLEAIPLFSDSSLAADGWQLCRGERRSGRGCWRKLTDDQRLQRFDRLEIFGRDFRLWNGEIELRLDGEHQIDHVHRCQTDIHQQGCRVELGCDRILVENGFDESKQPALDVSVLGLHFSSHLSASNSPSPAGTLGVPESVGGGRDYSSAASLKTVNPV